MKILLVEDDQSIAEFIASGLETAAGIVDIAYTGTDGSYIARVNEYDAIILDYSLPEKNGLIVCEEIRRAGKATPIIFLSILGDTRRKIQALEKGADDYMTKPFSMEELIARIHALIRRPKQIIGSTLRAQDLEVNTERQLVTRNNTPLYLTRKEYNLLEYLMRNQGTILSRAMIMEHVWNAESDPFSNTIEAHILNLRKKIDINDRTTLIRNIPGRGYTIDASV